jgi:P4 family phage/plasmid primase-like protien
MTNSLQHGSDYEIARRVIDDMAAEYDQVVYADAEFWRYRETAWEAISTLAIERRILNHDGTKVGGAVVKMTAQKLKSVLDLMSRPVADPEFFAATEWGVNCQNGFIRFNLDDGAVELVPHDPAHRCRHTIAASWSGSVGGPPSDSLLYRFLRGIFQDDPEADDKAKLLGEIAGAAIAGVATRIRQPKAHVLYGRKANNGKSTFLELIRRLLPETACASVKAGDFGEPRYLIRLAGKMFNGVDELSPAALESDTFKKVVTGERVTAHDVYRSAEEFTPSALHVFATNRLPPFLGGLDKGVRRRLSMLLFERSIPEHEMVSELDEKITENESDLLLGWAVEGASRLIQQGRYTEPTSSIEELTKWTRDTDPVRGWIALRVLASETEEVADVGGYTKPMLYTSFLEWAEENGYRKDRLPGRPEFLDRLAEDFPSVRDRKADSRRVRGITVLHFDKPDDVKTADDLAFSEIQASQPHGFCDMEPSQPLLRAVPPTYH